jgi:hypothetical protein
MKITKRNNDLNLEIISNGFILTLVGRDESGNYVTDKIFVNDLTEANDVISDYFHLPEDN